MDLNQLLEFKKFGDKLDHSLFVNEIKQELGLLPSLKYLSKPKEMLKGALSVIEKIPGRLENITLVQLLQLYVVPTS